MRKFQNGKTTIIQGDTLEMLDEAVSDGSVNLIFADPSEGRFSFFSKIVDCIGQEYL